MESNGRPRLRAVSGQAGRRAGERMLDMVASSALLALLAPLLALIAVAIKLDSRGPVLFRQLRVGSPLSDDPEALRSPPTFEVFKFRTMYDGADQSLHQQYIEDFVSGRARPNGKERATFKLVDDPRVTRVGRVLRRTSLDELPQLLNVLRGEMSLVGPRPVPVYEFEGYGERERGRLAVLPGITGRWQVEGRGRVTFEEMIEMDLDYVRNRSLWLDLKLLVRTVPAALSGRGAE